MKRLQAIVAKSLMRGAGRDQVVAVTLTVASAGALLAAFLLPFVHTSFAMEFPGWVPFQDRLRDWLIERGRIPVGDHYLVGIVGNLFEAREYFLAVAIGLFSMVFPTFKIAVCAVALATGRVLSWSARSRLVRIVAITGKWSMADVFIVAFMIVFFRAEGFHMEFVGRPGLYAFACAAILSSFAVIWVGRSLGPGGNAPNQA